MRKGGYKIVDLGDVDFTLEATHTIKGVYNAIEASYRKPIMLSGIHLGGVEKRDAFVNMKVVSGSKYQCAVEGGYLQFSDNDEVKYTASGL